VAIGIMGLLAAAVVLAAQGSVRTWGGPVRFTSLRQVASAPSWTAPCWKRVFTDSRPLVSACARVSGHVVWVQGRDPDGDGEAKVILLVRFGLVAAKFSARDRPRKLPGIGSNLTVTGPMIRGAHGLREVYARAVQ
jgi:hypothetical protein